MVIENNKSLGRIRIFSDIFTILFSFYLAYYIRFNLMYGKEMFTVTQIFFFVICMIPLYLFTYNLAGLYAVKSTETVSHEITIIIFANILCVVLFTAFLFVFKFTNFSRYLILLFAFINTAITTLLRIVLLEVTRSRLRNGKDVRNCIVIGKNNLTDAFLERVESHPFWGYRVKEVITVSQIETLQAALTANQVDVVVAGLLPENYSLYKSIMQLCEENGVKLLFIPYHDDFFPAKPFTEDLDGLPIVDTRFIPLEIPTYRFGKRLFDIFFSIFAIILTSPLLIFAAIMTKVTSPGPILFKQERVGYNRKTFNMYKFRSMRVQTTLEERAGWSTKHDTRKTKWGTLMRKTSIDELPQFFNVLKGDMSVIGPRPERPQFVEQFKKEIPRYMVKHQVNPGITGWAQVNGLRGDTSIEKRIEFDLFYIENWSFALDFKIVFLTIFKGFINKNAY